MSVMRKAMVYLGLVDDEEFYADDDVYYADEDDGYEEARVPVRAGARRESGGGVAVATEAPPGPVTIIRGTRREEPAPAPAARSSVVKAVPMPATRVHVMEPR